MKSKTKETAYISYNFKLTVIASFYKPIEKCLKLLLTNVYEKQYNFFKLKWLKLFETRLHQRF